LKPSRLLPSLLVIVFIWTVAFLLTRSTRHFSPRGNDLNPPNSKLAGLSLLEPDQVLAKVGSVELRGRELREALQIDFHVQMSHSSLSPEELSIKVSAALDKLIEDELLAQEARRQGMKTLLTGAPTRQDLASQYLKDQAAKMPLISDAEVRNFYKSHGEKFYVPKGVQVRELFLPHQGTKEENIRQSQAYRLAEALAVRIRKGESLEALAQQYAPEPYRERAKGYLFKGSLMDAADEQRVLSLNTAEVVGPIRVEGGVSIFQAVAQVRGRFIPFSQVREKIKTYLEARRVEEARTQRVSNLRRQIPVERSSPGAAMAAVN
jgi:PPIC-type PPIASE domain